MHAEQGQIAHPNGYVLDYLVSTPGELSSPYLHVFFHGMSRIKSQNPPVFSARKDAVGSLGSICLFFSDPIHRHTADSACGWFLLGEDHFMPAVYRLSEELLAQHGLKGVVWHGPSSGGYAAIKYCASSPWDDLAFVVSPHDDPTILRQWREEAAPFQELPGMGSPASTSSMMEKWTTAEHGRTLYAIISENDRYYALHHLRPILEAAAGHDSVRAAVLRNGLGHGFVAEADYNSQLGKAVEHWESRRGLARCPLPASVQEGARFPGRLPQ